MRYLIPIAVVAVLVALGITAPGPAEAHPLSFKGGTMTMFGAETDRFDVQTNYTFSRHLAIGASYMRVNDGGQAATFAFPQLNWLVKRWNLPDSQGNIYLYGGAGYRNYAGSNSIGGLVGIDADYESRRVYTSFQHQSLLSPNGKFYRTAAKVGGAPVLANMNQVAPWIIFKIEYASYMQPDQKLSFIPALRLIYKKLFLEGGYGVYGVWYANAMVVF